jgi:hypothetical protein
VDENSTFLIENILRIGCMDMENKDCIIDHYLPTQDGYPYFFKDGKKIYKRRQVLEDKLGRPVGEDKLTLDICGNKSCISPDHLYEGTYLENATQRLVRGTNVKGSAIHTSKLTEETAYSVLGRLDDGETGSSIAEELNVSPSQITRLRKGESWNHVFIQYEKDKEKNHYD